MKKSFTFGILVYNHENFLIELLESIKYQIEHYGDNTEISLIVADDASQDSTVYIVNRWIQDNRELFFKVKVLTSEKNRGTVYNFQRVMQYITDNDFKVIAGDDVFGKESVFEACGNNKHQILTYMPYVLNDGIIQIRKEWFVSHIARVGSKKSHRYHEIMQEVSNYFYTPCTYYKREQYKYYHKERIPQLVLFEDDPLWYSILHGDKKSEIIFKKECITLYRTHENAITFSATNSHKSVFQKDYNKYKQWLATQEKNILVKLWLFILSKEGINKYLYLPNYVYKVSSMFRRMQCNYQKKYKDLYTVAEKKADELQVYYNRLRNRADALYDIYINEIDGKSSN